jgi:hypothetical protein
MLPWSALLCVLLWQLAARRGVKASAPRWALMLLLLWITATAVFLLLQDALGATGSNENLLILAGVLVGYGLADLCVRVFWERNGKR